MKPSLSSESNCRYCRYYAHEGRRGGHCRQLNVDVQGSWKACSLAIPPFSPAWESLGGIMAWQEKALAAIQGSSGSGDAPGFGDAPVEQPVELLEKVESIPTSRNSMVSTRSLRK